MERFDIFPLRLSSTRILPLVAAIALPACSPADPPPSASPARAPALAGPSQAERLAFARAVSESFEAGDRARFDGVVDWRAVVAIATEGLGLSSIERSEIYHEVRRDLTGERGFAAQLLERAKHGAHFHFLGERRRGGEDVLLFRMAPNRGDRGVAYYEYVPRRSPDGKIRAADIYVYLSGELLSQNLRQLLLPTIADRSRSVFDRLDTGEQVYVGDISRLRQAAWLLGEGKSAEALAIYRTLRPETLKHKVALIGRLRAAQAVDEKDYMDVMNQFQKLFPNDPCLDMILLDSYMLRNDYPGALKAIDRFDQAVGGDPFLDLMRASVCLLQGNSPAAESRIRRAIEREPTLQEGHMALMRMNLERQDYGEVLARMIEIQGKFGVRFDDIETQPRFAGFIRSPRYSEWLRYRKLHPEPASAGSSSGGAKTP